MKNYFKRSKLNPILKPQENIPWESSQVYNPTIIFENNEYHLFYRAVGSAWVSKIGFASSINGEQFTRTKHPILHPELKIEKNGTEDPRITKINDKYFLTYTAYDGDTARLCLATSKDLKLWVRHGEMIPNWDAKKAQSFLVKWDDAQKQSKNRNQWLKAGAIFPEKINKKYWMLFGDRNIWLAHSSDGLKWEPIWKPFLKPRNSLFDSLHVEMGPPPIKTDKGWLAIYHGIDKDRNYRLGFVLLDLLDPTKIIYRSNDAIFEPSTAYEISGIVDILPGGFEAMEVMSKTKLAKYINEMETKGKMPKVTFCCGAVLIKDTLRIYYGAGDTYICTATANINDILDLIE